MNTVLSQLNQMLELCEQSLHPRSTLSTNSAMLRMEIKLVKTIQDAEKVSALLCQTCAEIGTPNTIDLTVELGRAIDE